MRLVVFFLLLAHCYCDLQVSVDRTKGSYSISIGSQLWLQSSHIALYADDRWYSSNDSSLSLIDTRLAQGDDPYLGSWNETQLIYKLSRNGAVQNITGHIRQWLYQPAISFHLDTGDQMLTNNHLLNSTEIRTVFPSFNIEKINSDDNRGFFTFQGVMVGFPDQHAGVWNSSSQVVINSVESGPVVLFDMNKNGRGDTVIISPFSQFMATSLNQVGNILQYGVMGSMIAIPANYNHSLVLFYSAGGINRAMRAWGQMMQRAYNRNNQLRDNDITVKYLGYYTDGGAYYYYNREGELNYEDTILAAHRKINLPFHYIQLDSWWYYKGLKGGVSQWKSRPDVFPNGLPSLYQQMNKIPLAAHNRYWAIDNVYSDKYAFLFDEMNQSGLPVGNDSFWIDLLKEAAQDWGLIMYEQDWLHIQMEQFNPLLNDINLGRQWLMSMAEGAEQAGITIQYCSPFPRHVLQALEISRVTQARVSYDYTYHITHQREQWNIGVTSLLSDAVGLASFKDTFWSTTDEPGSSYKPSPTEPVPEREIALATLSTGPVGPGDGINFTNVERIMKCCRQDGLILKPDRAITTIDIVISDWAEYNGSKQGELYSTESTINDQTFHVIFASAMIRDYSLTPSLLDAQSGVIWPYYNTSQLSPFDEAHPLDVSAKNCDNTTFCVWYLSPLWQFNDANSTKYALLGEYDKWTVISRRRISAINTDVGKTQTTVSLEGVAGEMINLSVYHSAMNVVNLKCPISSSTGQGQLIISPSKVACSQVN